jgi:hypothetical protein
VVATPGDLDGFDPRADGNLTRRDPTDPPKTPTRRGPEPCLLSPFIAYPASARGATAGSRLAKPPEGLDLDPVGEPRDHRKARKWGLQDYSGVAKSPLDFLAFSWKVPGTEDRILILGGAPRRGAWGTAQK